MTTKTFAPIHLHEQELDLSNLGLRWGISHTVDAQKLEVFVNVKKINFCGNACDYFPLDFSKFTDLEELNLAKNDLGYWWQNKQFRIGYHFEKLTKLRGLDLSFNNLVYAKIPDEWQFLETLEYINLSNNHLGESNYGEVLHLEGIENLRNCKVLDISNNPKLAAKEIENLKKILKNTEIIK